MYDFLHVRYATTSHFRRFAAPLRAEILGPHWTPNRLHMQNIRTLDVDSSPFLGQGLCRVVADLASQGWCQGTGGNFSVTLGRKPLRLLITRSGVHKRELTPEELMVVGPGGSVVDEEAGTPSAEAALHAAIVERTAAASVLHVHSVPNTLLSEHFAARGGLTLGGYEMLKGLDGITSHEVEVFVPVLRNSQDMPALAQEVSHLLSQERRIYGFLLAGHGLYTWGSSLDDAHRHVEIFEFLFECVARRIAFEPFLG